MFYLKYIERDPFQFFYLNRNKFIEEESSTGASVSNLGNQLQNVNINGRSSVNDPNDANHNNPKINAMMQKLRNSKETSKVSDQERVNSLNNALNNLPSTNDKIQNKINEMRNRVEKDKFTTKKPVKTNIESSNTGGQTHVRTKTNAPVKGHGHEDVGNNVDA